MQNLINYSWTKKYLARSFATHCIFSVFSSLFVDGSFSYFHCYKSLYGCFYNFTLFSTVFHCFYRFTVFTFTLMQNLINCSWAKKYLARSIASHCIFSIFSNLYRGFSYFTQLFYTVYTVFTVLHCFTCLHRFYCFTRRWTYVAALPILHDNLPHFHVEVILLKSSLQILLFFKGLYGWKFLDFCILKTYMRFSQNDRGPFILSRFQPKLMIQFWEKVEKVDF